MSNDEKTIIIPSDNSRPEFDRKMGALADLKGIVLRTHPSNIQLPPDMTGYGGSHWVIQTFREQGEGDTVFIQQIVGDKVTRIYLPAAVANVVARQRQQLTDKSRSKAAKAKAMDRKARGIAPGFQKAKSVGVRDA